MAQLPTGTVTFLFTDVEGSTRLLQTLGDRYRDVLSGHGRILRDAIAAGSGGEVRTEGDSFFAAFPTAAGAILAAVQAQRGLAAHQWPDGRSVQVRMGLHTGEGVFGGDNYIGLDVHRAARIAGTGHGGQVLVSSTTAELVKPSLPQDLGLRDLGRHRLKDLARAERIYQLTIAGLPAEFPPIRSLETPTNLPVERTSFVGRAREVHRVTELVKRSRLVTLTGAGGSGKTRVALMAARALMDGHPDGVYFVALASITDPDLVPSRIAEALAVKAEGRRPVLDTLHDQIRDRELLLVIDNFEHVMEAAPVVAGLLDAARQIRVLVTSRERLRLAGEQELPVPPLDILDAMQPAGLDVVTGSDAVVLFVERAAAADPGFRLTDNNVDAVVELCRRLDGLPLAIELAASRTKLLPPEAILKRMERRLELLTGGPVDLPARQRTLREAIGWSTDLLGEHEAALFRRLSVFAGGWTLESAEAVAWARASTGEPGGRGSNGDGDLGGDVLGRLGSLVDKSLVLRIPAPSGGVRFGMLETIRDFGGEQLEASGEAEDIRDRHAGFYLELAETAEPQLRGMDRKEWLDGLEMEHDNLRAAVRWVIEAERATVGLRLVGALWRFWHFRGHLSEGRRWTEAVLSLPGSGPRTAERGRALTALGGMAYWQEDLLATRRAYEEALAIAEELGDRYAIAEGLYNMGYPPAYEGDLDTASTTITKALALYEDPGIHRGSADCLWLLAIVARLEGDTSTAMGRVTESLRIHRELGDQFGATDALHVLGRIALAEGDLAACASSFLEALEYDESVGNRTGMGIDLDALAAKASAEGSHLRAVRLTAASEAIKEAAGGHAPPPFIDLPDPRLAAREAFSDAAVEAAWEEGRVMTLDQAVAYARQETA